VVSSRQWPLISKYRASVRTQSPKVEMIDSLFKRVSDTEDEGIFRWVFMSIFRCTLLYEQFLLTLSLGFCSSAEGWGYEWYNASLDSQVTIK
jgi:hypothetical protein